MADIKINKGTGVLPPDDALDDLPLDLRETILRKLPKLPKKNVDEGFDDYMKDKLSNYKIKQDAIAEANKKYEGPFGKLGEYFSKNERKRDQLFDYISSVGQSLVRPTNTGEARGLLSDVSAGLAAGEQKIAGKAAAEADAYYKGALAMQAARPKTTTAYDNAVNIVAGQNKYAPGSPEFNSAVAKVLALTVASPALTALNKSLVDLESQLQFGSEADKTRIKLEMGKIRAQINALLSGDSSGGALSESVTATYDNTKKNKKNESDTGN